MLLVAFSFVFLWYFLRRRPLIAAGTQLSLAQLSFLVCLPYARGSGFHTHALGHGPSYPVPPQRRRAAGSRQTANGGGGGGSASSAVPARAAAAVACAHATSSARGGASS